MKLVFSDGTIIENVTASAKILQVKFDTYSEISAIYAQITNDTLNGAHWETDTSITLGSYNGVEIATSSVGKNYVQFNLIDSRSAEVEELQNKVSEQNLTIAEMQEQATFLTDCLLEMSEIVYADNTTGEEDAE